MVQIDLHTLKDILQQHAVQQAYLFGSHARGTANALSDIDIAVLFDPLVDKEKVEAQLFADLSDFLHTDNIDLIDIATASPLLAHRSVLRGKKILSRSTHEEASLKTNILHQYEDTRHLREMKEKKCCMTLDHESIIEKKVRLVQALAVLSQLRTRPLAAIQNDEIVIGALLHYLMIAIETILDIGSHILTEDFSATPETYEDVITLLSQKEIISKELADRSSGMGRFRNKMVHEYVDVDIAKVYTYLQKAPDEFEEFNQAFSAYLKKASR
jgi:uncharacterized protein YutE (UPF0331/DUF86 family)/predicted nucleotidyltransferase